MRVLFQAYWPFPLMHQQQNIYHYVPMQMKQAHGMQTFPQFFGQKPLFCTYLPPPTFQFPSVPGTAPAEMSFRQENVHKGSKAVEVLPEQEFSEIKGNKTEDNDEKISNTTINAKNNDVVQEPHNFSSHSVENLVDQDFGPLERLGKGKFNTNILC